MSNSRSVSDWTVHTELKAVELSGSGPNELFQVNDANPRTLMSVNSKSSLKRLRLVTHASTEAL